MGKYWDYGHGNDAFEQIFNIVKVEFCFLFGKWVKRKKGEKKAKSEEFVCNIYLFAIQLVCALGEYLIYAIWIAECDKAEASASRFGRRCKQETVSEKFCKYLPKPGAK